MDLFGGTGSVTHLLKNMGKQWSYNDILTSNAIIANALFSEGSVRLKDHEFDNVFRRDGAREYETTISDIYEGVYYTDDENNELDIIAQNILAIEDPIKRAEAYYCLFQAALVKRPYNLFHRANLDVRLKNVKRSFGNKVTWDRPIYLHMKKFYNELVGYRLASRLNKGIILNTNAFKIDADYDLIYIDTPYTKNRNKTETNYFNFYHFLDALANYHKIRQNVLVQYKHKPTYSPSTKWFKAEDEATAMLALLQKFRKSIVCMSYRSDGYPTVENIHELFLDTHDKVKVFVTKGKYVLSKKGHLCSEIIICGEPKQPIPHGSNGYAGQRCS